MEPRELLLTAARAAAVYALILVVIRLSGKRAIGNFSAFDLLVALMLGEVVDEIIYGDVTFAQGSIAIVTVAILQYANSWMSYWNHGMDKVLEGSPSIVVRNGRLERDGMRKERMNEKDVMAELRLRGVADVHEVRLAAVENDGQMSVVREDWAEPLQKGDLPGKEGKPTGEREKETVPSRRTDSPEALG
ncbi:MAG: DUF421 domain-containing protein [Gemmatimonadaceae bacterium]